jgi:hypothetical protein
MNKVVRRIRAMTAQQSIDVHRIEQPGMDAFYERIICLPYFLPIILLGSESDDQKRFSKGEASPTECTENWQYC